MVWRIVSGYIEQDGHKEGEQVLVTRDDLPLVHGRSNAVT